MKIDTADLSKKMLSLTHCLEDYWNLNLDRAEAEIDDGNSATMEVIDNLLGGDESKLLQIMYGKEIEDLRSKMVALRISLSEVQQKASDLSFRIYKDREALKHD